MKQLKRFLSGLLVLCLLVSMIPVTARAAESGTCGENLTWTISDDGVLTISGTGPMNDYGYSGGPWGGFTSVVVEDGVTTIGAYAFYRNSLLSSISLPEGLISIGGYAFYCCEALEEIKLPSTLTSIGHSSFYRCNGLEYVDIPYGVTGIPTDAFHGCRQLKTVNIPASVTTIGSYVFEYCDNLESVVIPDSVISIGDCAFGDCQNLTTITVGKNVTTVGMRGFAYNPKLTTVYFRGSMPEFGCDYGFSEVKATVYYPSDDSSWNAARQKSYGGTLTWTPYTPSEHIYYSVVTAPTCIDDGYTTHTCTLCGHSYTDGYQPADGHRYDDGVVTAPGCGTEGYTTYTCTACGDSYRDQYTDPADHIYEAIVTGAACTENGYTTYLCTCGESYVVPSYSDYALGHSYEDGQCIRCHKDEPMAHGSCGPNLYWEIEDDFTLVIYGNGPMTDYASASEAPWYSHRASIRAIELEEGVTTVGDRAFYNCTALTDVSFSSTVSTIGTYAFRGCTALEAVTLPGTVTELKGSAFRACTALTTVTFGGNAPAVGNFVFNDGAESLTVRRYEGTTGFDIAPWTGFTMELLHVGQWIVDKEPTCTEEGSRHIDCAYCQETITETLTGGHNYVDGICTICQETEIVDSGSFTAYGRTLTWKLDVFGNLTISGTSSMKDYNNASDAPWYAHRQSIKTITLEEGITGIGDLAFYGCSNLTTVSIPDSVIGIGLAAFSGCSSLTDVIIPDSVTSIDTQAFEACSSLTSITIPDSVTSIGNSVFYCCSGLASVTLGEGITRIGSSTFRSCTSLTGVTIPDSVTTIGSSTFYGCTGLTSVTIPDSVTTIGDYAFYGCTGLTSVTIPDSVTTIGNSTFYGCTNLASVSMGNSVTSIGNDAFYDCSSLASISIPDSVTSIGDEAFYGCSSLTSISIGNSVTSIGNHAFNGCSSLTSISIPDSVTTIGYYAFNGCNNLTNVSLGNGLTSISRSTFNKCSNLASVTIGNSVKSIDSYAFHGCSSLASVIIPDSVTSIGDYAFAGGCTSLASVTIGNGVTSIGEYAFLNCTSMASLIIGNGVTSIGDYAFNGCSSLESVAIPDGVTSIGNAAFQSCSSLTSVSIGNSVTSIGYYAFNGCSSLTSVSIPDGVTSISTSVFQNCSSLTSVTIPDGVISIGDYTFSGCSSLTGITLPDSVTSIGNYAFSFCTSLTDFYIPDSMKSIGERVFYVCESLKSIVIPDSVESIGEGAFHSCTALEEVRIGKNIKSIEDATFGSCESLKSIVIPDSVHSIGASAFNSCIKLENVVIGRNVQSIGSRAFYWTGRLRSLVFRGDAPVIDNHAFLDLTATCYYPAFNETWTADVMQDYGGFNITWVSRYMDPVKILNQPEDFVGMVGEMASFTVETDRDDVTYQWYFSADNGASWEKSSCIADTLKVEFKAYRLNYLYRCEVTDADGNTVASEAAVLAAQEMDLVIETQPESYVGAVNDDVSFTVEATGNGLTYQWYYSDNGGTSWAKSGTPGFATSTLLPILRTYRDGYLYYCQITDIFGNTVNSDVVSMDVKASEIIITKQPENVINAKQNELYAFDVEAEGDNLVYRWEFSNDGGATWQLSWNGGYNSPNLTVRMNPNRDGYLYRCCITSGLKIVAYSEAVMLDMQAPSVELIGQSNSIYITANETATFTVEAEGTDLTYLWYRSDDKGTTWKQTYLSGYNTNILSFASSTSRAVMYMCKITDGSGKVIWSSPVKLQILSAELKILTQPVSTTCAMGETVTFTVKAQGDGLKYQWYSFDGVEWKMSYLPGYNTDTFSFEVNASRASKSYKCIITDAAGNTVETDVVSVTIR